MRPLATLMTLTLFAAIGRAQPPAISEGPRPNGAPTISPGPNFPPLDFTLHAPNEQPISTRPLLR